MKKDAAVIKLSSSSFVSRRTRGQNCLSGVGQNGSLLNHEKVRMCDFEVKSSYF